MAAVQDDSLEAQRCIQKELDQAKDASLEMVQKFEVEILALRKEIETMEQEHRDERYRHAEVEIRNGKRAKFLHAEKNMLQKELDEVKRDLFLNEVKYRKELDASTAEIERQLSRNYKLSEELKRKDQEISGSCFSVTYAEGTMCSYKSQKQSCSITFPTEVRVERTESENDHFKMTCNSSCSLTDNKTSFQLYKNTETGEQKVVESPLVTISSTESFFCTVKDRHDLLSNEVCVDDSNCWTVNYDSRRICGLKGSSVNISSKYSHPEQQQSLTKRWYKMKINTKLEEEVMENNTDVNYQDDTRNQHILRLNNLDEKNSGEYEFRIKTDHFIWKSSNFSGVTLIVTALPAWVYPASHQMPTRDGNPRDPA
ncbi:uncharacterized protein LOC116719380 [Xiphophorus hellerii]|uniref:uncharacterized protein LOC116719380 n=1 Tax=Xiphophorus hellerii TaxID=8084 RepID=UPI0013B44505|nr:uncharacterized protein LOC116719380 [Xiphophorus hellerii]